MTETWLLAAFWIDLGLIAALVSIRLRIATTQWSSIDQTPSADPVRAPVLNARQLDRRRPCSEIED